MLISWLINRSHIVPHIRLNLTYLEIPNLRMRFDTSHWILLNTTHLWYNYVWYKYVFFFYFCAKQVHPPMSLVDHLAKASIHKPLRRLKVQGVISPEQWAMLYPANKRIVSSSSFDAILLYILLRHVCKLSEPYPEGWEGIPNKDGRHKTV